MASSSQLREWWDAWECDTGKFVRHSFPGDGRTWDLWVADASLPAWQAFTEVMVHHNYLFLESAGGTYSCRNISGSNKKSLHAFAIAVDLNPSQNPYGNPLRHNYPAGFVDDVKAIKFDGERAFTWGGDWSTADAMHFQIDLPPAKIGGAPTQPEEENVEEVVKGIQRSLQAAGYNPGAIDGQWGPNTENAHKAMTADAGSGGGAGSHTHPFAGTTENN